MSGANNDRVLESIREAVLDRVGAAVIVVDEQGAVSLLNVGAARLLGIPEGSHVGQPIENLIGEPAPDQPDPATELDTASRREMAISAGFAAAGASLIQGRAPQLRGC